MDCGKRSNARARLAQLVERKALNLVVVGSSPTVGNFSAERPQRKFLLHFLLAIPLGSSGQCSLAVEHPLSKREVVGSNPAIG